MSGISNVSQHLDKRSERNNPAVVKPISVMSVVVPEAICLCKKKSR